MLDTKVRQKVSMVSLGCPKNLVDAEVMLGFLDREGYEVTTDEKEAEIIIVNTCSFIKEAKQESIDAILDLAEKDWSAGEYVRLEKNPLYFRATEGLPKFDTLVFRFMKDAPTAISALIAGQCDILDTSLRLDWQIDLLTELQRNDQVKLVTAAKNKLKAAFRSAGLQYSEGDIYSRDDRPGWLDNDHSHEAWARFPGGGVTVVDAKLKCSAQYTDSGERHTHSCVIAEKQLN